MGHLVYHVTSPTSHNIISLSTSPYFAYLSLPTAMSTSNPPDGEKTLSGGTAHVEQMDGGAALAEKAPSTSDGSMTLAGKQFADSDPAVHQAILNVHAVISHAKDGKVLIQSARGDPDSPRSWPNWKRYGIVILASFLNNLVRA